MALKIYKVLLFVITMFSFFNIQASIEKQSFYSQFLNQKVYYYLFKPDNNTEKLPILYLLHGAWGSYKDWYQYAGKKLNNLANTYNIIIITPEAGAFGWYLDSPLKKNSQIESYFLQELIPQVEKNLNTTYKRAIAGLSMGGHGALILALRNPAYFQSISSMSGITDLTYHPLSLLKTWHVTDVLGHPEHNIKLWQEHSAYYLVNKDILENKSLLITVGDNDIWATKDNNRFHQHLKNLNIIHEYQVSKGKHSWQYWLAILSTHIAFHSKNLK